MLANFVIRLNRWINRLLLSVVAVTAVLVAATTWLWRDRATLNEIDWPPYPPAVQVADAVTATWLGVSTLLFDDGETQILIDGFFSRPTVVDLVLRRPVMSDVATINYALNRFDIDRLAAIVPVHSHYDHAMDIGAIANRSSASVLGSASTGQILRGAGVPEEQIMEVEGGALYSFGEFTVRLIASAHAPIGWGGSTPLAGSIDEPLTTPAPVTAWREGGCYSIVITHPQGTTIVQGSAGFVEGALTKVPADVVLLSVAGLDVSGRRYAEKYWQELVTTTGATRVAPIHFDDFTRRFGEIDLPPRVVTNLVTIATWLEEFRSDWDNDVTLHLPVFGERMLLYAPRPPDI